MKISRISLLTFLTLTLLVVDSGQWSTDLREYLNRKNGLKNPRNGPSVETVQGNWYSQVF